MHGTGPLFHRDPEGIADQCGNAGGADDLPRQLGQRLHGRNHVHDLKARLTAAHDGLLARDHHHRHRTEMRIGSAGRKIQRTRTECRYAHTRFSSEPAVRCGHKGSGLFVPGQHQFNLRISKRLDNVEIFLPRHAENAVNALMFQCRNEQIGALDHWQTTPVSTQSA
jgi:hypothetical protein